MQGDAGLAPALKKIGKKKNTGDINFIVDCMRKRFAFSNLNQEQLEACAEMFEYGEIQKDAQLYEKGVTSRYFYVIEQGTMTIYLGDGQRTTLGAGEGFGEMTLIYTVHTSVTIIADIQSKLWYLSYPNFSFALERYALEEIESNRRLLDKFVFISRRV